MFSFLRTWFLPDPEKVPRAIVFMSHGFSEHLGLYHSLGHAFQVRVYTGDVLTQMWLLHPFACL